jgi:hypothetical protein
LLGQLSSYEHALMLDEFTCQEESAGELNVLNTQYYC